MSRGRRPSAEATVRTQMLEVTPINLEQANALFRCCTGICLKPVPGAKFALAVADTDRKARGVAIDGNRMGRLRGMAFR